MIYLIHFDEPYPSKGAGGTERHVKHYIGYSEDVGQRFDKHTAGQGNPLMRAVGERGIGFKVVRTWPGTRAEERQLKRQKNSSRLCPVCQKEHLEKTGRRRIIGTSQSNLFDKKGNIRVTHDPNYERRFGTQNPLYEGGTMRKRVLGKGKYK